MEQENLWSGWFWVHLLWSCIQASDQSFHHLSLSVPENLLQAHTCLEPLVCILRSSPDRFFYIWMSLLRHGSCLPTAQVVQARERNHNIFQSLRCRSDLYSLLPHLISPADQPRQLLKGRRIDKAMQNMGAGVFGTIVKGKCHKPSPAIPAMSH